MALLITDSNVLMHALISINNKLRQIKTKITLISQYEYHAV